MNKSSFGFLKFMLPVLFAVAVVAFGQQIVVRDNASSTAPIDSSRVFGFGYQSIVGFSEVASSTSLVKPKVQGAISFQFNTADQKLYIRVLDSNDASWGGSISLTTLD